MTNTFLHRLAFLSTGAGGGRYPRRGQEIGVSQIIRWEIGTMGSLSTESYEQFLDSLKHAGVEICNETELRERLAEAQRWRFAFATLASNGRSLGIRFQDSGNGVDAAEICRTLRRFQLPNSLQTALDGSSPSD